MLIENLLINGDQTKVAAELVNCLISVSSDVIDGQSVSNITTSFVSYMLVSIQLTVALSSWMITVQSSPLVSLPPIQCLTWTLVPGSGSSMILRTAASTGFTCVQTVPAQSEGNTTVVNFEPISAGATATVVRCAFICTRYNLPAERGSSAGLDVNSGAGALHCDGVAALLSSLVQLKHWWRGKTGIGR